MFWLALYLPNLPLQAWQRSAPESAALAVTEQRRIVAANAAAARLGVRPGQGLASALALAPTLVAHTRDSAAEAGALRELATCALRYTPKVSLDPPSAVLLEVGASLRLFGGAAALIGQLERDCAALGYSARIAAAPSARAARWLAQAGRVRQIETIEALPEALAPLPLDVLDCAAPVLEMLLSIGALTLGDCLRLPRSGLARRGGAEVAHVLDQALGHTPDPRPAFVAPHTYTQRIELAVPTHQAEALLFVAKRLCNGLAAFLAARHVGVEQVALMLEHECAAPTPCLLRLGAPGRDAHALALLAREHLARLELAQPVSAVVLAAEHIVALPGRNTVLFDDPRMHEEDTRLLVERLRARLGPQAVWTPVERADHRPERAWSAARSTPRESAGGMRDRPMRPLWLLDHPQRLNPAGEDPRWHGPLALLAGPERIESGWWDDAPEHNVARDYFVATTAERALVWIFRDQRARGHWYLHGLFG